MKKLFSLLLALSMLLVALTGLAIAEDAADTITVNILHTNALPRLRRR